MVDVQVTSETSDRAAIIAALEGAIAARRFDSPELQAAVSKFARKCRAAGMPPEQVLIQLKALVRGETSGVGDWWRAILTDRSVRWSVEAYYDLSDDD